MPRIPRTVLIPLIVACALFMENMDSTVIATSLPAIARDLHEDPIALKLALTSYLLSLAIFIPLSGWMADRFGTRSVFRSAMLVFMGGSVLCALSGSLAGFVAARFLQGMGGAMMVPVGRLVVLRSASKAELVKALSYLTIPALVGPMIGPPLGGFISTYFHWRWIFFINIPICLLGVTLAGRYIENLREAEPRPLDVAGFVLMGGGLSALMMGIATAGRHLVGMPLSFSAMVIGVLLLWAYLQQARRKAHPLLDLGLLRGTSFRVGVLGGAFFRIGMGAMPFLLPLMLQLGFGLDPFHSGLLTFAAAAGALVMKTVAARVLRRYGFRRVLRVNAVLCALALLVVAGFTAQTPGAWILFVLLGSGCLRSLQFTSINALAYADIEPAQMSRATSLSSVVQQLAAGLGITVGAFALQGAGWLHGHNAPQTQDFAWAFVAVALVSLLSLFYFNRLPRNAGAAISGHVREAA